MGGNVWCPDIEVEVTKFWTGRNYIQSGDETDEILSWENFQWSPQKKETGHQNVEGLI